VIREAGEAGGTVPVLIERRKQLHERIGAALERLYAVRSTTIWRNLPITTAVATIPKGRCNIWRAGKQALGRSVYA
jgi:hypothetical protein